MNREILVILLATIAVSLIAPYVLVKSLHNTLAPSIIVLEYGDDE